MEILVKSLIIFVIPYLAMNVLIIIVDKIFNTSILRQSNELLEESSRKVFKIITLIMLVIFVLFIEGHVFYRVFYCVG